MTAVTWICISVSLGLTVCGIIIACITKNHKKKSKKMLPPLPPRRDVGTPLPTIRRSNAGKKFSSDTTLMPPHHSSESGSVASMNKNKRINYGPRGLRPSQFPCCPYDKQRNVPGQKQLIFWDDEENCYHCSRGHRFKKNGKLL